VTAAAQINISNRVNFSLERAKKAQRGSRRYSSTLSLTSALIGGGWSTPHPGCFTPGKENRYPLYRRLGGPQGRSRPHCDSIPGPSSPERVATPTELSRPTILVIILLKYLTLLTNLFTSKYWEGPEIIDGGCQLLRNTEQYRLPVSASAPGSL
jgi:hypothetical protein